MTVIVSGRIRRSIKTKKLGPNKFKEMEGVATQWLIKDSIRTARDRKQKYTFGEMMAELWRVLCRHKKRRDSNTIKCEAKVKVRVKQRQS
jgi:hypothetical protein